MNTIDRAKQLAAERNLSLYELTKLCGVNYNTLKSAEARGSELRMETINPICACLNISASQFFDPDFHLDQQVNSRYKPEKNQADEPMPVGSMDLINRYLELIFVKDDLWIPFQSYVRKTGIYTGFGVFRNRREPQSIDLWRETIRHGGLGIPRMFFAAVAFELLTYEKLGHDLDKELRYAKVTITNQRKKLRLQESYGMDKPQPDPKMRY